MTKARLSPWCSGGNQQLREARRCRAGTWCPARGVKGLGNGCDFGWGGTRAGKVLSWQNDGTGAEASVSKGVASLPLILTDPGTQ